MGKQLAKNPMLLIGILIGAQILIKIAVNLFPELISSVSDLSTLENFTFSDLFGDDGVVEIILSAVILIAVFATFGIKATGGSKR